MSNLTLKQKIIVGGVVGVMLVVIGIYGYVSLNKEEEEIDLEEGVYEIENEEIDENEEVIENVIVVHITGEVNKTGILVLKEGARIADAIDEAEGITEKADLDEVNLAYVLSDGLKIYIPNKEDKNKVENIEYISSGSGNNVIVDNMNNGGSVKVNINTANQSELESLPGIGQSTAIKILEYRQQNGKFQSIEDIQNVKGIGDSKFQIIKEYITVN